MRAVKAGIITIFHHHALTSRLRTFSSSTARRTLSDPVGLKKGKPKAPSKPIQESVSVTIGNPISNSLASDKSPTDFERSRSPASSRNLDIISSLVSFSFASSPAHSSFRRCHSASNCANSSLKSFFERYNFLIWLIAGILTERRLGTFVGRMWWTSVGHSCPLATEVIL